MLVATDYKAGDHVEVDVAIFSNQGQEWVPAVITDVNEPFLHVTYKQANGTMINTRFLAVYVRQAAHLKITQAIGRRHARVQAR